MKCTTWTTMRLLVGLLLLALPTLGCSLTRWMPAAPSAFKETESQGERSPIKTGDLSPRESAEACFAAAGELDRHGRTAEAIVMYERARGFQKNHKGIARRLAVLYERQDNHEKARREYARALEESPKDADLLVDFGFFHYQRGEFPQAEQAFRRAVALEKGHERAWINLGLTLAAQGRREESLAAFEKVVTPAAAQSNLGVVLMKQGDREAARHAFEKAITLDRNLKQPQAMLAYLAGERETIAQRAEAKTSR